MMRFTIRELSMLVLVIAAGLGWWATQRENMRLREENDYLLRVKEEAVAWKQSAKEQKFRADFVSDQLYDRSRLHRPCPECGKLVKFPPLTGSPWQPPPDSIWNRQSLIVP